MEELVKEMGFDNEQEFHNLVASVDLSNSCKMNEFINWRETDGTKKGLLSIINN